jgi:DNA-binding MarR family transcriptional regulator
LLELKLVAAAPGEPDRRIRSLRLTDDGRQLEGELTGAQMDQLAAAFEAAAEDEATAWRAVMQRLARDA